MKLDDFTHASRPLQVTAVKGLHRSCLTPSLQAPSRYSCLTYESTGCLPTHSFNFRRMREQLDRPQGHTVILYLLLCTRHDCVGSTRWSRVERLNWMGHCAHLTA